MLAMSLMFAVYTREDMSDGTLIAIAIGGVVSFLLSMRKGRPMRTVIAYTIAAVASGYYLSAYLASKLGLSRVAAAWAISFTGWATMPLVPAIAKFILKEAESND